jgi:hypothetical protein
MPYVPRGVMHDAVSEPGAPSLRITAGAIAMSLTDLLLEALSRAALHSPDLRRHCHPAIIVLISIALPCDNASRPHLRRPAQPSISIQWPICLPIRSCVLASLTLPVQSLADL